MHPDVRSVSLVACAAALAAATTACGDAPVRPPPSEPPAGAGIGPSLRLPSLPARVARRAPLGRLRCARSAAPVALAHLELFAHGRVVLVSAGIGVAPPRRREGAYVRGGACRYPIATTEPTGLVELARRDLVLGDLFALWGQPLSSRRLARWRATVIAHVDGRRWHGDPRAIPLRPRSQIVVQAGGPSVPPHADYRFPPLP